ncbi:hypothetical protein UP10_35735 [Bradyrhizobium sp. LTSPM299]|uniref:hypothetical protein n=1 Tax=Bradyrhizobium sp. LTSPM299 TaxID=1619233 RepID=UPI0005CADD24|nr:hypothetical protein UP10_35735 [Bradyrhizobium sp. LTSPM299]
MRNDNKHAVSKNVYDSSIDGNAIGVQSTRAARLSNTNIVFNGTAISGATGTCGNNGFAANGAAGTPLTPVAGARQIFPETKVTRRRRRTWSEPRGSSSGGERKPGPRPDAFNTAESSERSVARDNRTAELVVQTDGDEIYVLLDVVVAAVKGELE